MKNILNYIITHLIAILFLICVIIQIVSFRSCDFINRDSDGLKQNSNPNTNDTIIIYHGSLNQVGEDSLSFVFNGKKINENSINLPENIDFKWYPGQTGNNDTLIYKNILLIDTTETKVIQKEKEVILYANSISLKKDDIECELTIKNNDGDGSFSLKSIIDFLTPGGCIAIILAILSRCYGFYKDRDKKKKEEAEEKEKEERFNRNIEKYFEKIISENKDFNLRIDNTKKFPMENAFIALSASAKSSQYNSGEKKLLLNIIDERKEGGIVIIGEPGAGKSLSCKNIIYKKSKSSTDNNTIPVLIKLGNYKNIDREIIKVIYEKTMIEEHFDYSLFEKYFKERLFLILFDGFDEVTTENKPKMENKISNFIDNNPNCRCVITCRENDYKKRYFNNLDVYKIDEFEKEQVLDFIEMWLNEKKETNHSKKEIYTVLQNRSELIKLTHNPFMLSVIIYLYEDKQKELPYSRGKVYDLLLKDLLQENESTPKDNPYPWDYHKRLKLFATIAWETYNQTESSIEIIEEKIEEIIKDIKPGEKNIEKFICDVVRQCGLLEHGNMNEGYTYSFSHKSIQDYLVSYYVYRFEKNEDLLLEKFKKDDPDWIEFVRYYCNISNEKKEDLTGFIQKVRKKDESVALRCLAEAKIIKSQVADDILMHYISHGYKSEWNSQNIKKSLSAIISYCHHTDEEIRERAERVLNNIKSLINNKDLSQNDLFEITEVLSGSYIKEAVEIFVQKSGNNIFFKALKNMKEVRDFYLMEIAKQNKKAIDCLYKIGDDEAYITMKRLLWDKDDKVATYTAQLLSTRKSVEHLLKIENKLKVKDKYKINIATSIGIDVWEPFDLEKKSPLYFIMNRIAYLTGQSVDNMRKGKAYQIHSKIAIPLYITKYFNNSKDKKAMYTHMEDKTSKEINKVFEKYMDDFKENPCDQAKEDWKKVLKKSDYDFRKEKECRMINRIYVCFFVILIGINCSFTLLYQVVSTPPLQLLVFIDIFAILFLFSTYTYDDIENEYFWEKSHNLLKIVRIGKPLEFIMILITYCYLLFGGIIIGHADAEYRVFLLFALLTWDFIIFVQIYFAQKARKKKYDARNPLSTYIEN